MGALTPQQLDAFHSVGYVKLPGAVPRADVESMSEAMWAHLSSQGIRRDDAGRLQGDAATWNGLKLPQGLSTLNRGGPSPESCPQVCAALDAVLDSERVPAKSWGQALITLPVAAEAWLVPASIWHFDHAYGKPREINGVNVFLLVEDVAPGGGGTAVLRNSPLLMDRLLRSGARFSKLSAQNQRFLSSHPWLRGLKVPKKQWTLERNARYLTDTDVDGIPARVEELTGAAGDVFLCHPALLHAPAMNVSERPRLMRTQRVYTKALRMRSKS